MDLNLNRYLIFLQEMSQLNIIIVECDLVDSVKTFNEGGSSYAKFCTRLEKNLFEMEQFFFSSKTISFLPFKQIFDADTALDDKPMDYSFPKFFRFIFLLVS